MGIKFDEAIRPIVLKMPKMSGYVKTIKVKDADKDKNNKLIYFRINNEKLLEKHGVIWTKIDVLFRIIIELMLYQSMMTDI